MTEKKIKGRSGYALRQVAPGVRRWVSTAQRPAVQASPVDPADPRLPTLATLQQALPRLRTHHGQIPLFTEALENTLRYAEDREVRLEAARDVIPTSVARVMSRSLPTNRLVQSGGVPSVPVALDPAHPMRDTMRSALTAQVRAARQGTPADRLAAQAEVNRVRRAAAVARVGGTAQGTLQYSAEQRASIVALHRSMPPHLRAQFVVDPHDAVGGRLNHRELPFQITTGTSSDLAAGTGGHMDRQGRWTGSTSSWLTQHALQRVSPAELYGRYFATEQVGDALESPPLLELNLNGGKVEMATIAHLKDSQEEAYIRRAVYPKKGVVDHELLTLPDDVKRQGIGGKIVRSHLGLWRDLGLDEVRLDAEMDGPMVWPRYGFVNDEPVSPQSVGSDLAAYLMVGRPDTGAIEALMDTRRDLPAARREQLRFGTEREIKEFVGEVLGERIAQLSLADTLALSRDGRGLYAQVTRPGDPLGEMLRQSVDTAGRSVDEALASEYDRAMRTAWKQPTHGQQTYTLKLDGSGPKSNWADPEDDDE